MGGAAYDDCPLETQPARGGGRAGLQRPGQRALDGPRGGRDHQGQPHLNDRARARLSGAGCHCAIGFACARHCS
eukprot:10956899-Alexandrium_andersonii.AAC.1